MISRHLGTPIKAAQAGCTRMNSPGGAAAVAYPAWQCTAVECPGSPQTRQVELRPQPGSDLLQCLLWFPAQQAMQPAQH